MALFLKRVLLCGAFFSVGHFQVLAQSHLSIENQTHDAARDAELRAFLDQLNGVLKDQFVLPSESDKGIKIFITNSVQASDYEPGARIARINTPPVDKEISHYRTSLLVFAHEYGHAIFQNNFAKACGSVAAKIEKGLALAVSLEELDAKIAFNAWMAEKGKKIITRWAEKGHMPDKSILEGLASLARAQMELASKSDQALALYKSEYEKYFDLIQPYSELFADAVVVAFTGDGHIITKAISQWLSGDPRAEEISKPRDFTSFFPLEGWSEKSKYQSLNPTRSVLWTQLFSEAKSPADRSRALSHLYRSMGRSLCKRDLKKAFEQSPQEMNEDLIRSFDDVKTEEEKAS